MGVTEVEGLDGVVVIRRDEWGIPHVSATSAHDAFVGQGYVQAEDRLGQLEYDRRRAQGRWSEVVGAPAVAFDRFARRLGLRDAARREHAALPAGARAATDAFAAGVNAYLGRGVELPPDLALAGVTPAPWEGADCCAVFMVRHIAFGSWQLKLWRGRAAVALGPHAVARLFGADTRPVPLIVPPGELFAAAPAPADDLAPVLAAMAAAAELAPGSNAWAIAGSRTRSGRPLLAGDPHRAVEVPGVYYQCHLACDAFDAVGLAFVGVPGFPHFGHNRDVAWCVTNAMADYQDLYVERFAPEDPSRYEFDGAWHDAATRREEIGVRGASPVVVDCTETRHGPVIIGDPASGYALSLRSPILAAPSAAFTAIPSMLSADDVDALDAALDVWVEPVNNVVMADRRGTIAYRVAGKVPERGAANLWGPVPGWTGAHEWTGFVADAHLPRARDAIGGAIVTANQRITDARYPSSFGIDVGRPDRAMRLHARIGELDRATVADMASIHRDRRSLPAAVWVEKLLTLAPRDDSERDALDRLRGWDLVMDPDSVAAAIYMVVRDAVCRRLAHDPALAALRVPFADEPPSVFTGLASRLWGVVTPLLAADDPVLLPPGTTWAAVLRDGLADALGILHAALGDDPASWRWGVLHRCTPAHPLTVSTPAWASRLDPPAVEVGGEWDTVNRADHVVGGGFAVTTSAVARYVFDLDDWDRSAWVVPHGVSGHPDSPHWFDQQEAWAAGELVPMRYSETAVQAGAAVSAELRPPQR